jgi:hypothetical protein
MSDEPCGTASRVVTKLIVAWAIAELLVWGVAAYVGRTIPSPKHFAEFPRTPVEALSSWDGSHYAAIASQGYSIEGAESRRLNLFPLLPAVARLLGGSSHAPLAGILLSQFCLLGSMLLLTKLAPEGPGAPLRLQPGFWLLVSPLGFFLSAFYTESLFLFLSLLIVLACRSDRLAAIGVAGVLAGLTRPTAIFLPVFPALEALQRYRQGTRWRGLLFCAATPLVGIALYVIYVGYLVGDPFGYLNIHRRWGNEWTLPFRPLLETLVDFARQILWSRQVGPVDKIVAVCSSIGVLALMIWGWRRVQVAFIGYVVVTMLLIHAELPFRATARYELVLFPVFLLLPHTFAGYRYFAPVVAGIFAVVQLLLAVRFMSWKWVA